MQMKSAFCFTLFFFIAISGILNLAETPRSVQIQKIDQQIEQLQEKKRGFEARALRHENYAEYLQFDQEAVLETRRHLQLADENRAKAALIQYEIDKLVARRNRLQ